MHWQIQGAAEPPTPLHSHIFSSTIFPPMCYFSLWHWYVVLKIMGPPLQLNWFSLLRTLAETNCYITKLWSKPLMLDMSKAFDMVKWNMLYTDLADILIPDELMMMNILHKDVIRVRCGATLGDEIQTHIGVPQHDCASALFCPIFSAKRGENNRRVQQNSNHHRGDLTTPSYRSYMQYPHRYLQNHWPVICWWNQLGTINVKHKI